MSVLKNSRTEQSGRKIAFDAAGLQHSELQMSVLSLMSLRFGGRYCFRRRHALAGITLLVP